MLHRALVELISAIDEIVEIEELGDPSLEEIVKVDLASYLMHLSCSDGMLKRPEVEMICDTLEMRLEADAPSAFIQENNVYSTSSETTVPASMKILIQLDMELHKHGLVEGKAAQDLYSMFEMAGKILVSSDDNVNTSEQADMETYLNMLQSFIRENDSSRDTQFDEIVMPSKKRD